VLEIEWVAASGPCDRDEDRGVHVTSGPHHHGGGELGPTTSMPQFSTALVVDGIAP
jgi:hypothetical protein